MYQLFGLLKTRRLKGLLANAIVCGMLMVLSGCAIPRLGQAESAPELPPSFQGTTTADNSSQVRLEEFYTDPLLMDLLRQALMGNRELRILEQEVQIARNEILARRGAYLPFITGGADAGFEKPSRYTFNGAVEDQLNILPGQPFPDPLPNYRLGLNGFWQLDIWRQLRNARDAAAQRYIAASEKRNYFVTRLVAEVAENYYELMALDNRMGTLDQTISLQEASLKIAIAKMEAGKGTALAVQRFQAEVRKNQSEKLIVRQEIIGVENRINFLLNRYPEPVNRESAGFLNMTIHKLSVGAPSELLQNRADIRQAERELTAAGLDVAVARANFFPKVSIVAGIGFEAFNPKYLFNAEALAANAAGNLMAPLINKKAIQAEYLTANARQLQAIYNYQRTVLNAFTQVVNRVSKVENYSQSIELKKAQLKALELSVESASQLFINAKAEYIEVLFAQRDLMEARMVLIATKKEQLSAVVNAYQALGGGLVLPALSQELPPPGHWWNLFHGPWPFEGLGLAGHHGMN